jgi:hypothetical protein
MTLQEMTSARPLLAQIENETTQAKIEVSAQPVLKPKNY